MILFLTAIFILCLVLAFVALMDGEVLAFIALVFALFFIGAAITDQAHTIHVSTTAHTKGPM
jgi:hypothetical protein